MLSLLNLAHDSGTVVLQEKEDNYNLNIVSNNLLREESLSHMHTTRELSEMRKQVS